jgi:chlorobactene glucosyltransferase
MSEIILYLQAGVALGILVLLAISLNNLRYLRRLNTYPPPAIYPCFSVLVPARNEEENIWNCVSTLLSQDYPNFEVIVLDDNSTDRTWEILQELAGEDTRLKLLKGKPLPQDWLGKHWACHQLAQAADGELLLFVDADTTFQPDMLRYTAGAIIAEKASLISVLPQQIVVTWSELLGVPGFYFGMFCGIPLGLTRRQRNPLLLAVLGQFLLFRREAYTAAGGYVGVRQNIVDDIAIGRKVVGMGLPYSLLDGNGQVSCRMYRNFNQTWTGLTKSTFASFNFDPFFLIFMLLIVLLLFVEPLVVFIMGLLQTFPFDITAMAGLGISLSLLLFGICYRRFQFPLYLVLFYPVTAIFMVVIASASMVLTIQGKAKWKDRSMPKWQLRDYRKREA